VVVVFGWVTPRPPPPPRYLATAISRDRSRA
jgi:hypothetical protein